MSVRCFFYSKSMYLTEKLLYLLINARPKFQSDIYIYIFLIWSQKIAANIQHHRKLTTGNSDNLSSNIYIMAGVIQDFWALKPEYSKKQRFSSSFLHTWSKHTGPKWSWSTLQANFIHIRHGTSLLSSPWSFWTCLFTSG